LKAPPLSCSRGPGPRLREPRAEEEGVWCSWLARPDARSPQNVAVQGRQPLTVATASRPRGAAVHSQPTPHWAGCSKGGPRAVWGFLSLKLLPPTPNWDHGQDWDRAGDCAGAAPVHINGGRWSRASGGSRVGAWHWHAGPGGEDPRGRNRARNRRNFTEVNGKPEGPAALSRSSRGVSKSMLFKN
jgi:hypothetical protein